MISSITSNPNLTQVIISTGNILNANNTIGIKTNVELLDGLKLALNCTDLEHVEEKELLKGKIYRGTKELISKIKENERPELNVGVKIFLNKNSSECVEKAITAALEILDVKHIDNVVLAYHHAPDENEEEASKIKTPCGEMNHINDAITDTQISKNSSSSGSSSSKNIDKNKKQQTVKELIQIWTTLEEFAFKKDIKQLGISDINVDTLTKLHAASRVPPKIAQINLESCCFVPQELRDFCAEHDIQLLTHGDPEALLTDEPFILPGYKVDWALRFQVHVRCRGVLSAKGYIVGATRT